MKAAQITEYGDVSVIKITEIDKPTIQEGQVLVEVQASSLNPFDTMIRAGYMKDAIPLNFPATLGGDIAGTVVEVSSNVSTLAVGDTVYGQANVVAGNSGAFAEYAATSAGQVAKAPANVTATEAAALPLVGVSALQAITEHIKLQSGQKILITGGAGGIGQIAIQIAKSLGAYVATTATGEDMQSVQVLGADEVIDYKTQDYTTILKDYDAVFDTVGHDELQRATNIVKSGGIVVSMAGQPEANEGVTAIAQMTQVSSDKLNQLRQLAEAGTVKPNVGKVFSLDEIQEAFTARESGTVAGKVVLAIKQ